MPNVESSSSGDLYLDGAMPLGEVANDSRVRNAYPLLAHACAFESRRSATGTLAESVVPDTLCQRSPEGVNCALTGGGTCAARDASSSLHAILGGGPCWRVLQSAVAPALLALDASVALDQANAVSIEEFCESAHLGRADLKSGATVSQMRVVLPSAAAHGFQHLITATIDEHVGASISIAAARRIDGDVRLVLGGVAPTPYRVYNSVEEEAAAGGLDEDTIAGLADRALLDAEYEAASAGRFEAAAALLREAITEIAATSP